MIFSKVNLSNKIMCSKEVLLDELKKRNPEVLITLGAGDIDKLVEPIKKQLMRLKKNETDIKIYYSWSLVAVYLVSVMGFISSKEKMQTCYRCENPDR